MVLKLFRGGKTDKRPHPGGPRQSINWLSGRQPLCTVIPGGARRLTGVCRGRPDRQCRL